jgi:Tfp pilus assembly protein PilN
MDNFFLFFKIVFIGIMVAFFMIVVIAFVSADAANERHKAQIVELNKTIIQQDSMIEEIRMIAHKAIQQRNQYEKKVKKILSQRIIRSCNDEIALSADQGGATVYECRPVN